MSQPANRLHRRVLRHAGRAMFALAVLICLLVGGAMTILRNLDTNLVKRRLQSVVAAEAGLELDYQDASVSLLHGFTLHGLTIRSPPAYRDVAPLLLSAGEVQLGWSVSDRGPTLRKVTLRDIELTVVVDETGHSSIEPPGGDAAAQLAAQKAAPQVTLTPGKQLASLVSGLPEFDHVGVGRLAVNLIRTRGGQVTERGRIEGLGARVAVSGVGAGRRIELDIGSEQRGPVKATGWYEPAPGHRDPAQGELSLRATLSAGGAELHAKVVLDHQSILPALIEHGALLTIDGSAKADGDSLEVKLDKFEALERAVEAKAALTITPSGAQLDHARGELDLGRLVTLVPPGPLRVELHHGQVHFDLAGLWLGAVPAIEPTGKVELDGKLAGLRVQQGAQHAEVESIQLALKASGMPDGGIKADFELPELSAKVAAAGARLDVNGGHVTIKATLPKDPRQSGQAAVNLHAALLFAASGALALLVQDAQVGLQLGELKIDPAKILESSAVASLSLAAAALDVKQGDLAVHADHPHLSVHSKVADGMPAGVELDLPIDKLSVRSSRGWLLPPNPLKLALRVTPEHVDKARPARSTFEGKFDVALGGTTLHLSLKKREDAANFDLALDAPSAALATAYAPPALALPGDKMAVRLSAKGQVDGLFGTPSVKGEAHAHVDRLAATLSDTVVSADALDLDVGGKGTTRRFDAHIKIAPHALALDDDKLGDGQLAAHIDWDASRPALDVSLDGAGSALPAGHLGLQASWDRARREVDYQVDGDLGHLTALSPFLPDSLTDEHWIDLSDLRVRVKSHGKLTGVVLDVRHDGTPLIAPHPLETLRGQDTLDLALAEVHYVDAAGVELTVPLLALESQATIEGPRHLVHTDLRMPSATIVAGAHKFEITGLHDVVTGLAEGDLGTAPLKADHQLTVAKVEQDVVPLYPISDLALDIDGRRTADGTIHLDRMVLENKGGGTKLAMDGALIVPRAMAMPKRGAGPAVIDHPVGFSTMTVGLDLEQRLDTLAGDPARFRGSGAVRVKARIASGDLHRFHVAAATSFDQVSLELPVSKLRIAGLDGQVPLVEDILILGGKTTVLPAKEDASAYPTLRFSDQRGFLSDASALRIDRVSFGDLDIEDLAGNIRLSRNLASIDQLEARMRGGHVAGQLLLDWRGADSTAQVRARLTGIQAHHGGATERFDGNLALSLTLATRSLDGRIEVVRIGRHHLLDLLDEFDPHHQESGINHIRSALALGYPERARVDFDRGFAGLSVTFGGLAQLVHIGEVHGIPTGPLIDRYLGAALGGDAPGGAP